MYLNVEAYYFAKTGQCKLQIPFNSVILFSWETMIAEGHQSQILRKDNQIF